VNCDQHFGKCQMNFMALDSPWRGNEQFRNYNYLHRPPELRASEIMRYLHSVTSHEYGKNIKSCTHLSSYQNLPQCDILIISVSVVNVPESRAHPRTVIFVLSSSELRKKKRIYGSLNTWIKFQSFCINRFLLCLRIFLTKNAGNLYAYVRQR
jgi:hypothetical protein